jgi:hypothetical protein
MGKNKGARGEREVVKLLQPVLNELCAELGRPPPLLERNQMQTHRGGYDIVGVDWMALEVKRCETLNLETWWRQCLRQANIGQEPVLVYRKNRGKWRVLMYGWLGSSEELIRVTNGIGERTTVDIALEPFLVYFKGRCALEMKAAVNCL